MELINGQTVWTAFAGVDGERPFCYVDSGVVEHAEGRLVRMSGGRLTTIDETLYDVVADEATARSIAAKKLQTIADVIAAEANRQREAAAGVAAKAAVVYA